jgi:hypothetical protein
MVMVPDIWATEEIIQLEPAPATSPPVILMEMELLTSP